MTKYLPGDRPQLGRVALMNETRVFAFGKPDQKGDADPETNGVARDIILNVLTTPKYRILSSMFIVFRLMDNAVLFTFILMLFTRTGDPFKLTEADKFLAGLISMELFYDLMLVDSGFSTDSVSILAFFSTSSTPCSSLSLKIGRAHV